MPQLIKQHWMPADGSGLSRHDKRGGEYHAYLPDEIARAPLSLTPELSIRAAQIERSIQALSRRDGAGQLESIARLLMRSEAISSSRIEGIAPNVDKVVLAELALTEVIRGFKENAEEVARNLQVLRSIETTFANQPQISVRDIEQFQIELLGTNPTVPTDLRIIQNWIGGANRTPIGAEFIPPPPGNVRALMEDLCTYLNGATHGALIQAAIAHAQFETIHPFAVGNGRVGRALIHGTLQRRGLTSQTILPISLILETWSNRYVAGLTAFRRSDLATWIEIFLDAAEEAVNQANLIADEILQVQQQWETELDTHRRAQGMTRAPRADSAIFKILLGLPAHPIVTVKSVERLYGVTASNVRRALDELATIGILRTKVVGVAGTLGYYADAILDLITLTDRQLASSQFDTKLAPPTGKAVPGLL